MKLSEPQQQAYSLYLAGQTSQRDIADIIGVTERTIYNWIRQFSWQRIREAAMAAPSIITEKISRHIISLLDSISAREEGKQFPTMQEAEITRKMVMCMDKFKRYPTMALSMQTVDSLVSFINQSGDFRLADQLQNQADEYFAQSTTGGFKPCEPEYGINPTHVQREVTFAEFCANADGPLPEEQELKPETENTAIKAPETQSSIALQPISGAFQEHEKTGNLSSAYPHPGVLEDNLYQYAELPRDCPLTPQNYIDYKHILLDPTDTDERMVPFREGKASYAWLQYNLFQFYLPPGQREFIGIRKIYEEEKNTALECQKIIQFFKQKKSVATGT